MTDTTQPTAPADVSAASDRLPEPRSATTLATRPPEEYWDLARCGWVRASGS